AVFAHAARHDTGKMREIRFEVDGDAVKAHPAPQPYADRGNLVLGRGPVRHGGAVRPHDPDAYAILAPLPLHVEAVERADDPFFQRSHESAHVLAPSLEVEHDIGHAL